MMSSKFNRRKPRKIVGDDGDGEEEDVDVQGTCSTFFFHMLARLSGSEVNVQSTCASSTFF